MPLLLFLLSSIPSTRADHRQPGQPLGMEVESCARGTQNPARKPCSSWGTCREFFLTKFPNLEFLVGEKKVSVLR